ncbi:MAG: Gfo/Idh/MocA family protein [Hyphomicrobiaceae bacterium]
MSEASKRNDGRGTAGQPASFGLIGAAGYIAPRHLRAIKENSGVLKAALDPSDSVGIIDSFFPDARFFTEFERFDRYVDLMRRNGEAINYVSVCSPNYLHDAHVRFALRAGADAICEKPIALNPWNIDALESVEHDTGRKINTILQLRLHPTIIRLKDEIAADESNIIHEVDLTYVAPLGRWFAVSWKGDEVKSGGIATTIGVQLFDMLGFVFGPFRRSFAHHRSKTSASGYLEFQKARVRWFLSVDAADLPQEVADQWRTYRSIVVNGRDLGSFDANSNLHSASYREILGGRGFGPSEARQSVEIAAQIRKAPIELNRGEQHPHLALLRSSGRLET